MKKGVLFIIAVVLVLALGSALADNQTIDTAMSISVNQSYSGIIASTSESDYYRFTLSGSGFITVSFSHAYVDSSDTFWRLWILDSSKNEYMYQSYVGNVTDSVRSYAVGLPAGTYYVMVDDDNENFHYRHSSESYQFTVNYSASNVWEEEFNNNIPAANPISINTAYSGSIKDTNDLDFYKFTLKNDGVVTVSFSHDYVDSSDTYWELWLLNSSQNEYLYQTYAGNISETQNSYEVGLPAGTYYIKVNDDNENFHYRHSSKTYQFSVNYTESDFWEKEFNNNIPDATPISINTTYSGAIRNTGDMDFFRFTLESNGYITISFSRGYVDSSDTYWRLWLLNSSQNEYMYQEYSGNGGDAESIKIGLPAGTYYVKVDDDNENFHYRHSSKTYQLSVNFHKTSSWETEFNNSITNANLVNVGSAFNGVIRNADDDDYYSFQLKAKSNVFIRCTHDVLNTTETRWDLRLIDSTQKEYISTRIAGNQQRTETSTVELDAGTYYVHIRKSTQYYNYRFSTVPYTLIICSNYVTDGGLNYLLSGAEATFIGPSSKKISTIKVPDNIKIYGNTYKVVKIEDGACKGLTKLSSVSIGKNVRRIGKKAFMNCTALKTVSGCAGVTTIENSAFYGCKALKKYDLGNKTKVIGNSAFYGCTKLASVSGGKSVTKIDVSAFRKCTSLKKIVIQSKVSSIGKDAFNGCKSLKNIEFKTKKLSASTIGANAFKGIAKKATIKCPSGKLAEYKKILRKRGVGSGATFK